MGSDGIIQIREGTFFRSPLYYVSSLSRLGSLRDVVLRSVREDYDTSEAYTYGTAQVYLERVSHLPEFDPSPTLTLYGENPITLMDPVGGYRHVVSLPNGFAGRNRERNGYLKGFVWHKSVLLRVSYQHSNERLGERSERWKLVCAYDDREMDTSAQRQFEEVRSLVQSTMPAGV